MKAYVDKRMWATALLLLILVAILANCVRREELIQEAFGSSEARTRVNTPLFNIVIKNRIAYSGALDFGNMLIVPPAGWEIGRHAVTYISRRTVMNGGSATISQVFKIPDGRDRRSLVRWDLVYRVSLVPFKISDFKSMIVRDYGAYRQFISHFPNNAALWASMYGTKAKDLPWLCLGERWRRIYTLLQMKEFFSWGVPVYRVRTPDIDIFIKFRKSMTRHGRLVRVVHCAVFNGKGRIFCDIFGKMFPAPTLPQAVKIATTLFRGAKIVPWDKSEQAKLDKECNSLTNCRNVKFRDMR